MRPFNLEEYLKNPSIKIITRNHCPVRIICTNRLDNHDNNIVALIHSMDPEMDIEYTQYYPEDGMYLPAKYEFKKKVIPVEEDNTIELDTIYTFRPKVKFKG